jgi:peptidylprolyl isomerase
MANLGEPNTNNSQFYITTSARPHLDYNHVVFGRVTEGKKVIKTIGKYGNARGDVAKKIRIVNSGEVKSKL